MIPILLTRWRLGLGIAGALAFLGLAGGFSWAWQGWTAEKALRKADKAAVELAQSQSEAKALADARKREMALQAHTAKIEDERNELQDRFAALADRYARANRVRREANQGVAGGVPATGEDHSAGVSAQGAEAAELVGITRDDFDRCTVIAGDLVKAREWALGL